MKKPAPEFSRPIAVEGITPDKIRHEKIEATAEECAALAARFDLRHLENFKADLDIRRVAGNTAIRVSGKLSADLVQACAVSLQDVHGRIESDFETFFTEDQAKAVGADEMVYEDDESTPEMAVGGMIDLGEVAAQYLSLEIEPYPRAPGVSLAAQMAENGVQVKTNPFQVLEKLKKDEK